MIQQNQDPQIIGFIIYYNLRVYELIFIHLQLSTPKIMKYFLEVDFWSEIGPESTRVDFLVDPLSQDRILHYLAFYGLDVDILIEDLQQEIDKEDVLSNQYKQKFRPKRQNTLLDLLPFFSSQNRPRRRPQQELFNFRVQEQPRFPRKFPSNSGGTNSLSSPHPPQPTSPISSFEPQNSTNPGMIFILLDSKHD